MDENESRDDYGMLKLCQHGCGNDAFLIVNGSERGFVWELIEWVGHYTPVLKNTPDLIPPNDLTKSDRQKLELEWVETLLLAKDSEKMTFSDWYIDWLEQPPYILPRARKELAKTKRWSWLKKWKVF